MRDRDWKKHSSIALHANRSNVAAQVGKFAWIDKNYNFADEFTKRLNSNKSDRFFGDWTY